MRSRVGEVVRSRVVPAPGRGLPHRAGRGPISPDVVRNEPGDGPRRREAGVLSFLPFGLGATDLVLASLLTAAGVEAPTAAAMTFGYRLVSTVPFALEGVISYMALSASLPAAGLGQALREAGTGLETGDPLPVDPLAGAGAER